MYQGYQAKQCRICHEELNQKQDLFHLVNESSICIKCIKKFQIIDCNVMLSLFV